jgi:hypothetical protein
VARFAHGLSLGTVLGAWPSILPPNVLYVLVAGLFVWPLLLGPALAGLAPLAAEALRRREQRVLALLACGALLLGVAVAWPAVKLRYFVPLAPIGLVLGMRILARPPGPGERRLCWLVLAGWAALVLVTLDDLMGGSQARPARWLTLAAGGALLLALPTWLRLRRATRAPGRVALLSGLPVAPLLALAVVALPGPGTAYHGAPFLPDFFGHAKEAEAGREAVALRWAAAVLREQDSRAVAGPVELLAFQPAGLVTLPGGADGALLAMCLAPRLASLDHVVLVGADVQALLGTAPEVGATAMKGALVVVAVRLADARGEGAAVLEVRRR